MSKIYGESNPCCLLFESWSYVHHQNIHFYLSLVSEVNIMTHYLALCLQIHFQGQVLAGEVGCTIFLNSHLHLCVFYRAAMIDCNIFSPPTVKPLTAVGRNVFPEQSGASGIEVLSCRSMSEVFFPSLCCGYFKMLC